MPPSVVFSTPTAGPLGGKTTEGANARKSVLASSGLNAMAPSASDGKPIRQTVATKVTGWPLWRSVSAITPPLAVAT